MNRSVRGEQGVQIGVTGESHPGEGRDPWTEELDVGKAGDCQGSAVFMDPGLRRDDSAGILQHSRPMAGYFYILASRRHGTLYAGCTTDLPGRVYQHREGLIRGFTRRHGVKRLVYFETYDDISDAILRERRVKEWQRAWKVRLIEKENPFWEDLAVSILGFEPLPCHPGEGAPRKVPLCGDPEGRDP